MGEIQCRFRAVSGRWRLWRFSTQPALSIGSCEGRAEQIRALGSANSGDNHLHSTVKLIPGPCQLASPPLYSL